MKDKLTAYRILGPIDVYHYAGFPVLKLMLELPVSMFPPYRNVVRWAGEGGIPRWDYISTYCRSNMPGLFRMNEYTFLRKLEHMLLFANSQCWTEADGTTHYQGAGIVTQANVNVLDAPEYFNGVTLKQFEDFVESTSYSDSFSLRKLLLCDRILYDRIECWSARDFASCACDVYGMAGITMYCGGITVDAIRYDALDNLGTGYGVLLDRSNLGCAVMKGMSLNQCLDDGGNQAWVSTITPIVFVPSVFGILRTPRKQIEG